MKVVCYAIYSTYIFPSCEYNSEKIQTNRFQTTIAPKLGYLLGFMSGTLVGVISDTHSVRTKPEVNLSGLGASHDPEGGVKTCFLFNFAPKMGYLPGT